MLRVGMVIPKRKLDSSRSSNKEQSTEQIVKEAESIVDDSYASVQRSLKLAENTRMVGAETLDKLNSQGEQIRRIQGDLDDIDELQDKADMHMRAINSITGVIGNKFRKGPKGRNGVKEGDKLTAKNRKRREKAGHVLDDYDDDEDDDEDLPEESRTERKMRVKKSVRESGGKVSDMYQADMSMLSDDHQDTVKKTDQTLDRIGNIVDDLKVIALEMGDEIDDHNVRLKVMDKSVMRANTRMKTTNAKIGKKI